MASGILPIDLLRWPGPGMQFSLAGKDEIAITADELHPIQQAGMSRKMPLGQQEQAVSQAKFTSAVRSQSPNLFSR